MSEENGKQRKQRETICLIFTDKKAALISFVDQMDNPNLKLFRGTINGQEYWGVTTTSHQFRMGIVQAAGVVAEPIKRGDVLRQLRDVLGDGLVIKAVPVETTESLDGTISPD